MSGEPDDEILQMQLRTKTLRETPQHVPRPMQDEGRGLMLRSGSCWRSQSGSPSRSGSGPGWGQEQGCKVVFSQGFGNTSSPEGKQDAEADDAAEDPGGKQVHVPVPRVRRVLLEATHEGVVDHRRCCVRHERADVQQILPVDDTADTSPIRSAGGYAVLPQQVDSRGWGKLRGVASGYAGHAWGRKLGQAASLAIILGLQQMGSGCKA